MRDDGCAVGWPTLLHVAAFASLQRTSPRIVMDRGMLESMVLVRFYRRISAGRYHGAALLCPPRGVWLVFLVYDWCAGFTSMLIMEKTPRSPRVSFACRRQKNLSARPGLFAAVTTPLPCARRVVVNPFSSAPLSRSALLDYY